ncbi:MAG TPA: endonuclease/exonuclease/phosphatase family protein [Candidatus Binataceae bacterium]|nr:endonuclease/exonuclease/phosphatase family protein [Candidatus Binataceae bacterium]
MSLAPPDATAIARQAHLFEPEVENRPSTMGAGPLRVVAFNAEGGSRFEGILRCFAREPLHRADVILLSEADYGTRRAHKRKVASELAAALGMSCAYVREFGLIAESGAMISFLGNAILSREPLDDIIASPLPKVSARYPRVPRSLGHVTRKGNQVAIVATIKVRGKSIQLAMAHLDSRAHPSGRERQIASMLEDFPAHGPMIFGGDLNTTTVELLNPADARMVLRDMLLLNSRRFRYPEAYEPLLTRLRDAGLETRGANVEGRATFTFARIIPPWMRPKLDWLALRELHPVAGSARVIPARPGFFAPRVSDHDFIAIDVAI